MPGFHFQGNLNNTIFPVTSSSRESSWNMTNPPHFLVLPDVLPRNDDMTNKSNDHYWRFPSMVYAIAFVFCFFHVLPFNDILRSWAVALSVCQLLLLLLPIWTHKWTLTEKHTATYLPGINNKGTPSYAAYLFSCECRFSFWVWRQQAATPTVHDHLKS